jgi:hypothetical protein
MPQSPFGSRGQQTLHHTELDLAIRPILKKMRNPYYRGDKMKKFIWSAVSIGMIALVATVAPDIKRYIRISTM